MFYYLGLLLYIALVNILANQIDHDGVRRKYIFVLVSLGIVLFQGFRLYTVGTDLPGYLKGYIAIGEKSWSDLTYQNYEVGYVILNKVLYAFGLDERKFMIAISALIQIPIVCTICQYSENIMISTLWYFSFGNFTLTFSGLRQSIAMAILFYAYSCIRNHRFFLYIFHVLLAMTFHKSAILCVLLYPLYHLNISRDKFIFAVGLVVCVFLLRKPMFMLATSLYYGKEMEISSTGAYTMFLVYLMLYIVSFYGTDEDKDFVGLRNILLLLTMIFSFSSLHNYIARVGFPLALYMSLFIPKLLSRFAVKQRRLYAFGYYAGLLMCVWYYLGYLDTLPFGFG